MYRVTIYNGTTETVIHEPSTDVEDAHLYECTLVQGASGEIDSLSLTITPNNPGYEKLNPYTTFIDVIDLRSKGEAAIFSGRVLSVPPKMEDSGRVYKNVVCEDRLGYLCDSIQPYTPMATYTVREFLELLLNNHNAQVEDYKKMYVGTVSFETSSGNVTRSLNYQTTWEALTGKLLELGGEIQLYTLNGSLYIDYVTELGTMGDQTIEIAKNMRSLQQDKSPTDIITRLIPLGDYLEEQTGESDDRERLNIASVNSGKTYIDDDDAIAAYGIIAGTVIWEDVTVASTLLEKGRQWLKDQTVNETISLDAYDLYAAGIDPDVIERYNYYQTINPLIGVNKWYRVAQKKINIIDPTDVTFTMGDQSTSLSSTVKRTGQDAADAAAAINANLSKTVATLIAGNAIIQYLQATVAEIEEAYIDKATIEQLLAGYATIEYLEANYLQADSAVITDLTAFAANIYTLLGGEGSFGELETIHLTAGNVVIDTAVIVEAVADTILADLITAEFINTDLIQVGSTDGTLWIDGSTILIYDENGNPRVQIGLDELGDYNLALWDEDGNCMWNASGATEYGINDGVVRDSMVADDANISGYKLNIDEICSIINSDGQYQIDAGSVTISGTTLDAWYTTITQEIEGLEGLSFEGLMNVEPWFCLWTSETEPPEEDGTASICGIAVCGVAICGAEGGTIWVDYDLQSEDGLYKWIKWKGYYADGHTEWGTPYCLTDGYVRTTTGVLQTELEVVQGWISERVWYTEIMDAVNELIETDVWSELNIWLNGIELEVGEMQSTFTEQYETLVAQVSSIDLSIDGITSRVESTEQQISNLENAIENIDLEGVSYFDMYFCLSDSGTVAPDDDADWTLTEPHAEIGEYKWARYLLYYEDGHTEWTTPYCLTDNYLRTEISLIEQTATSISERVSSVESWLGEDYESSISLDTCINQYVENSRAEIMLEVSSQYATTNYVTDLLNELELDGVVNMEAYFCLWTSATETPTSEVIEETYTYSCYLTVGSATYDYSRDISIEGYTPVAVVSCKTNTDTVPVTVELGDDNQLHLTMKNNASYAQTVTVTVVIQYESDVWTTTEPQPGEGEYKWVRYLLTYADGHTEWTTPYCVTDDLSGYATLSYTDAAIRETADELSASIISEARGLFVTADGWFTSTSEIYQYISQEMADITLTVEHYVDTEMKAELELYVDDSISKLSLSVSGGLGGTAAITLTSDGSELVTANMDLKDVREAFANDKTAITISGGTITFVSNTLLVESTQFTLDASGNATFSGYLKAPYGYIGGFEIGDTALFNPSTKSSFRAEGDGVYLGTDGIALGETFFINSSGFLYATSGQFTNIYLTKYGLYTGSHTELYSVNTGFFLGPDGFSIGGYTPNRLGLPHNFLVDSSGNMCCNSGHIASWTISGNYLTSGPEYYTDPVEGTYMGYDGWFQYGANTTWVRLRNGTLYLGYNETSDNSASGYLSGWQMNLDNNTQCLRMAGRGGIFLCGPELVVYQDYPSVSDTVHGALGATETIRVLTSTSGDWRELVFVNGIFNG